MIEIDDTPDNWILDVMDAFFGDDLSYPKESQSKRYNYGHSVIIAKWGIAMTSLSKPRGSVESCCVPISIPLDGDFFPIRDAASHVD